MKRLLLVLFAGLLLNVHVFAQWDDFGDYDDFDDFDEQTDAGGTTNITIKNEGTEDQSEQVLKLPNNQPIYLYFYNNITNPSPAESPAAPAETPPPPKEPEPIIEYRYFPIPAPEPPPPPPVEYRYIPMPPQIEYIYVQPPMPEPVPVPAYTPTQIRVVPGLPDPNSSRIYRLQVGSYSVHNTADMMAQRIRSAGLQAGIEYFNSLKRVFVPGVRAADACTIVQTLESLGFEEVWIRE